MISYRHETRTTRRRHSGVSIHSGVSRCVGRVWRCVMSAPDLNDLENLIGSLVGAIDCLAIVAGGMDHNKMGDPTCWLVGQLRRDTAAISEWFEKAHAADNGSGPRAVS